MNTTSSGAITDLDITSIYFDFFPLLVWDAIRQAWCVGVFIEWGEGYKLCFMELIYDDRV